MIAVIAALPREVAGLVRGVRADAGLKREGVWAYKLRGAVVVCAGMGSERATLAVRTALGLGEISKVMSVGLAGACDPGVAAGSVVKVGVVIDALSGERHAAENGDGTLVTTRTIASVSEKLRLYESYGAAVVDMEAATVARLAGLRGLPFEAIKGVSDAHDFELSSLGRFASAHGHFRTRAFALHTAVRPASWRKTIQLGAGSQKALRALTLTLQEILRDAD